MGYYDRDFSSGRYFRRSSNDPGRDYDSDFGGPGFGRDRFFGRQSGWSDPNRNPGSSGRGRGGYRNIDESSPFIGRERGWPNYRDEEWSERNRLRPEEFGGGGMDRGRMGGYGVPREYYDRDMWRGRRPEPDYDQDFTDRLRRGWNRLRNEARGWVGRGYDRGW